MRKGKMVAQGAHAAVINVTNILQTDMWKRKQEALRIWVLEGQRKICVGVETLDELIELRDRGFEAGICVTMITDRGDTEFHGASTVTCLALGPDTDENLDPITGDLKLL